MFPTASSGPPGERTPVGKSSPTSASWATIKCQCLSQAPRRSRFSPLQPVPQPSPDTRQKAVLCPLSLEIREKWWPKGLLQVPQAHLRVSRGREGQGRSQAATFPEGTWRNDVTYLFSWKNTARCYGKCKIKFHSPDFQQLAP